MKESGILSVIFFMLSSSKHMNPLAQFTASCQKILICDVIYGAQPTDIVKWRKTRALTVVIFLNGERKVTNENYYPV